eukprot:NODE_1756_length_1068_cov_504.171767.p1 GENE.NODE_1756_length_1068_cov_504.171767~~NODE_1756_length_1068_cov_504.171767.p1  ORF type:complete len:306 (-),score=70.16 NODE_1756_length_1068_cov_504.171767:133-1050(-)
MGAQDISARANFWFKATRDAGVSLEGASTRGESAMNFLKKLFGGGGALSSVGQAHKLLKRTRLTHDTHRFKFALNSPDAVLGLPVGHHIEVRLPGSSVGRAYTPVTGDETLGSFDLAVKVYPHGQVSSYLDSLKVGDEVEIAGPTGELSYQGNGVFAIDSAFDGKRSVTANNIGMIAGGTGLTPMLQIARHLAVHGDNLPMVLQYNNISPNDIMLKPELDTLAQECPAFNVRYAVDAVPDDGNGASGWPAGCVGRVNKAQLEAAFDCLPGRPDLVLVCGPSGFHGALRNLLLGPMGFKDEDVFEF